jgi:hypothetical protein
MLQAFPVPFHLATLPLYLQALTTLHADADPVGILITHLRRLAPLESDSTLVLTHFVHVSAAPRVVLSSPETYDTLRHGVEALLRHLRGLARLTPTQVTLLHLAWLEFVVATAGASHREELDSILAHCVVSLEGLEAAVEEAS